VRKVFEIALGVIAAFGGFADIGELVFNVQAGAVFQYQLLWTLLVGVVGIIVFAEMCGRVATVTKRPVFDAIRDRFGVGQGAIALIASLAINLLTVCAEVGGVALILQIYFQEVPFRLLALGAAGGLVVLTWVLPFPFIERLFGYMGMFLVVFIVAAFHVHPDWGEVAGGFVPHWQTGENTVIYWYLGVGVIAAALVPYEVYFFSSGAVEEGWDPQEDLVVNKANAIFGFGLGGFLSVALIVVSGVLFFPRDIEPDFIGTTALAANVPLGKDGLLFAFLGMLFAVGGAAVESAMSGAYSLSQFFGWEWGKYRRPAGAPRFTLAWVLFFVAALVVVLSGANPILITEYAVVLSVVALPMTYLPILLMARDRNYMGDHANGRVSNALGWMYLAIITVVSLAAVPLLFASTHGAG
jgi:Mn2+/Fe2+ NRAMP family transporter